MKRSRSLIQLSREHHSALVLAKRAQRINTEDSGAVERFISKMVEIFASELEPHFQLEEQALLPALRNAEQIDLAGRTFADHQELRTLFGLIRDGDASSLRRFGDMLEAHIRFEERELFPVAESVLTEDALALVSRSLPQPFADQRGV